MEVDGDVDVVADGLAQLREPFGGVLHRGRRLDVARRPALGRAGLERREARAPCPVSSSSGVPAWAVDADAVARRAAEQLVDRHAQRLALDVPERQVDAAESAGEDRTAAVEGVPVNRLPVVRDPPRILADQVRLDLLDRVCSVSARPSTIGSPRPTIPASVWILRNSQRGLTRKVSSFVTVIFSFGVIGALLPFFCATTSAAAIIPASAVRLEVSICRAMYHTSALPFANCRNQRQGAFTRPFWLVQMQQGTRRR